MSEFNSLFGDGLRAHSPRHEMFGHPEEVLKHPRLSDEEKRALLASWASDANAVPHVPTLRQLPDGSIVKVDHILGALRALDEVDAVATSDKKRSPLWQRSFSRRPMAFRKWLRQHRRPDDDDDPPPCPAYAAVRPRGNGGGAFAVPEPVGA